MTTAIVPRGQSRVPTLTIAIALVAVVLAVIALAVTLTDASDVTRSPTTPVEQVQPNRPVGASSPAPKATRQPSNVPAFYGCDRMVGLNRC